jgi:CheY-like chemotaxis protein
MILLVEDDKYIRESLEELLIDEGYEVATAKNGVEAFEVLESGRLPRVILLDLMMPIMDGFQFREKQLASLQFADIPVVAMSAYGDVGKNKEKLNVRAYLKKPVDIDDVLATVQKWSDPVDESRR